MRIINIILFFTILISCGQEKKLSPIFYEVSSDKGKAYILGSIHSSDDSIFPLPDYVMNRFYQSEEFIMELKPIENDSWLNLKAKKEENYFLKDHVSEETYKMVFELSENLSIPQNILTSLSPLEIISFIEEYELEKVGIKNNNGIESYLRFEANRIDIKVDGFESYDELIKNIGLADPKGNEELLKDYILNRNQIGDEAKELLKYWKEGNEQILIGKIKDYTRNYSNLTELLLNDRNKRMLNRIEELLILQNQVFIAVGLGHIIGENNLIEMLKEKGYSIKRIDAT